MMTHSQMGVEQKYLQAEGLRLDAKLKKLKLRRIIREDLIDLSPW